MQREKFPFQTGLSEMAARVRAFDWSATPLGEPDTWGPELRTAAAYVLESKLPAALVWGPDLTTIYNDGFCPILGEKSETLGRPFRDIWAEAWDKIGPIAARAYAGEATFIEDFPLEVNRFGYSEQAYFTFCYSPVRLANGAVGGMIDTVVETTNTVQARNRDRFLNQELGHRLRNMMAMVDAIAHQSLKNAAADSAFNAFRKRIAALGTANETLLRTNWESATITVAVETMLALHGGTERFSVSGVPFELGPKAILSLSMLLHELATNALKYGALSVPTGKVALDWFAEAEHLVLRWREHDGPPVKEPWRRGFGSRIIDAGLLGTGIVDKQFAPKGFEATFRVPLDHLGDS